MTRARGLALHLLDRSALERLARSAGSAMLADALRTTGYRLPPPEAGAPASPAEAIEAAIDLEACRRLGLLARWLGDRRALFGAVFDDELRRALRIAVRALAAGDAGAAKGRAAAALHAVAPRAANALGQARDLPGLARSLRRIGSPYGEPLARALRARGAELAALEHALDRSFAEGARRAAERLGGRLLAWVETGIDLENAWNALLGGGAGLVEGGGRLSREEHAAIVRESTELGRRRRLARVFAGSAIGAPFGDPSLPVATLEARVTAARIREERRAARRDPLGVAPILEYVLRQRAERANLRCINWGVAQRIPAQGIIGRLVVA